MKVRKVILCGTHPYQFNGYSKVMYELSKRICEYDDIDLHIFAFQNFYKAEGHEEERSLPDKVKVFDAYHEETPKNKGFGENLFVKYVKEVCPDIVIIYNDLAIISTFTKTIRDEFPDRKFKLIPYLDIVYQYERQALIDYIHESSDGGIAFTKYWKTCLQKQGFTKPLDVLEHGFNPEVYYPIPSKVARKYFEIDNDEFIIINLNRNQPRKRWDICIQAYVKFISKHKNEKIKLFVMTTVNGSWDIVELMRFEGKKYGMDIMELKNHFTFIQNPQKLTDTEINIMYNTADIGWNTCDGEGFGLCNFEQAGVGIPQIVPAVGGFKDFFNENNSITVDPVVGLYGDTLKDTVQGYQEICAIDDHVNALEKYYSDKHLRKTHGAQARRDILKYVWQEKAEVLRNVIINSTKDMFIDDDTNLVDSINEFLDDSEDTTEQKSDDIDIDKLIDEKLAERKLDVKKKETKPDLSLESLSPNELIELQRRIQGILNTPVSKH